MNTTTPIGSIHGVVYGGQQPIVGAEVFLFAIGTSAYGGTSISKLGPASNTFQDVSTNNYYVVTDLTGSFDISGDYTCTPGTVLYLYSINGNPTYPTGTNNSAASLMATLGTCPSGGTFAGQIPFVYMNEVSTVATAFAFAAYATNATNISIGPTGSGVSPSALAQSGLQNAADNAAKLFNIAGNTTGLGANTVTPNGTGTVPNTLINAIANVLAGCINSGGSSTSGCTQLFGYMPGNSDVNSGIQPSETATAAIYIAKNPGTNVTEILALEPSSPPFAPALTSNAPLNDFTIGITYTDASLSSPNDIAIDASGDAWVTNPGSSKVTKFAPSGVATSVSVPSANYLAIDTSGNVWVTSASASPSIYVYNNAGTSFSDYTTTYTLGSPQGVANDGVNSYIADKTKNTEFPYGPSGNADPNDTQGNTYDPATSLASVQFLAADVSAIRSNGFLWGSSESGLVCRFGSFGGTSICAASSGLTKPERIAIDATDYAWVPDSSANKLYVITGQRTNGNLVSTGYTGGGLSAPYGVALDGNATVWVANSTDVTSVINGVSVTGSGISKFATGGTALSPATGFSSRLSGAGHKNLAIDGSGDIWLANTSLNSVTEVIGVAGSVVTPLSAGAANGTIASKP